MPSTTTKYRENLTSSYTHLRLGNNINTGLIGLTNSRRLKGFRSHLERRVLTQNVPNENTNVTNNENIIISNTKEPSQQSINHQED